jgi:hypothetical protein
MNAIQRLEGVEMTKTVVVAVAGAAISGAVMFTVGATQRVPFETQEFVQTVDGGFVPVSHVTYPTALRAAEPVRTTVPRAAATTSVSRAVAPAQREVRTVVNEEPVAREAIVPRDEERSWQKTAMIIGGSAASGAGVGGVVNGKKGALIGAAIGGGAASIYEATRRR